MGSKYGSPFPIHLDIHDYVIINDWNHAKEVFTKEELLARPPEGFAGGIFCEKGMADISGAEWKDQW